MVGAHANKVLARLSIFHCTEVMEQLLAVMAKAERPSVNVIEVSGQLALYHSEFIDLFLPRTCQLLVDVLFYGFNNEMSFDKVK